MPYSSTPCSMYFFPPGASDAAAVFLRIDVAVEPTGTDAYRIWPCCSYLFPGGQPLAIAKVIFFPVFAAAHVHSLPLNPPFHLAACLFRDGFQRFVAVHPLVVYRDQLRTFHRTRLPVSNVPMPSLIAFTTIATCSRAWPSGKQGLVSPSVVSSTRNRLIRLSIPYSFRLYSHSPSLTCFGV